MSGELSSRSRRYVANAALAFERAPVEVALSVLLAVTFSAAIEIGGDAMRSFSETAAAAMLAIAVAWSASLLHALDRWTARTRWGVTAAGAIVAGIYGVAVADFTRTAEAWRAATLVAAAFFLMFAAPAFGGMRTDASDRMRTVNARITLRAIGVLLYGAALFAGLALAIAAVDTLFELDFESEIYGHVFGWIFLALVPWVIAGGIDDYVRADADTSQVAGVAHRMSAFLVPPLLAIYFLILYAYALRIAVTGEVPRNLLSPLVIAAGALAALALLLFDPAPHTRATLRPLRFAPLLFIPTAALGLWAVLQRLDQYGWTEFRALRVVVLLAFAALATGAAFQVLRRRRLSLHGLPITLAIVLTLAAVGPWSVTALSRRSQQARLTAALEQAGFTAAGERVRADTLVAHDVYEQLRNTARYLHRAHGRAALPPALARIAGDEPWTDHAALLGLHDLQPSDDTRPSLHARLRAGAEIAPRSWYIVLEDRPDAAPAGFISLVADSARLRLRVGDEQLVADLGALGRAAARGAAAGALPADEARVPVRDLTGSVRGELLVLELAMSNQEPKLHRVVGLLTLRN